MQSIKNSRFINEACDSCIWINGVDQIRHDAKIVLNWITSHGKLTFTKSELILAMRNKKLGKAECLQKAVSLFIDRSLISPP